MPKAKTPSYKLTQEERNKLNKNIEKGMKKTGIKSKSEYAQYLGNKTESNKNKKG